MGTNRIATTEKLVIEKVDWGLEAKSPHTGPAWRIQQTTVTLTRVHQHHTTHRRCP